MNHSYRTGPALTLTFANARVAYRTRAETPWGDVDRFLSCDLSCDLGNIPLGSIPRNPYADRVLRGARALVALPFAFACTNVAHILLLFRHPA